MGQRTFLEVPHKKMYGSSVIHMTVVLKHPTTCTISAAPGNQIHNSHELDVVVKNEEDDERVRMGELCSSGKWGILWRRELGKFLAFASLNASVFSYGARLAPLHHALLFSDGDDDDDDDQHHHHTSLLYTHLIFHIPNYSQSFSNSLLGFIAFLHLTLLRTHRLSSSKQPNQTKWEML